MSIFSERLKWLRERKRLTQQEMAEKLGLSRFSYTKYEYGQREPTIERLAMLPEILGESLDFIVGVTDLTSNAYNMYLNFSDAESKVTSIMADLESIQVDPHSTNLMTARDFDPDDFQSVTAKLQRLEKQLPLWQERMNLARDKLKSMLDEVPMVKQKSYDDLEDENGWIGLLFGKSKDPQ